MTEVLEHVPDPKAALIELHRVLRRGGVLCFSVPTSYTELVFWRLHPDYAENATHERIFTRPELERLIGLAGFEVIRWEGRNFLPAVSWVFHAVLRSNSDHTGAILEHRFVGPTARGRLVGVGASASARRGGGAGQPGLGQELVRVQPRGLSA